MKKIAFVYGKSSLNIIEAIKEQRITSAFSFMGIETFLKEEKKYDRVIVAGDIDEIKTVLLEAISNDFEVAIIPNVSQASLQSSFSLHKGILENLNVALNSAAKPMDVLFANDELVLHTALVGDVPPLNYHITKYRNKSFKERLKALYESYLKIKTMNHTRLTFKTRKSNVIDTVATGVIVIEHDNKTFASKFMNHRSSTNNEQLNALIISPNSIVEYLQLMTNAIFNRNKKATLPNTIGYIKSEALTLESKVPLPLVIDGRALGETPVNFVVKPKVLKIALPDCFWERIPEKLNSKETIKVDKLPHTYEKMHYLQKQLPFFTHASEYQYKALFSSLREEGKLSSIFMVLMLLSSVLATVGLYLNSASVVIGAMVLAPLMNPIVVFSMALLRQDELLSLKSLKTISVGILITLLTAAFIAGVLPFEHMTEEMEGRIKPSILDMIVAFVSGVAAAYVKNNSKIANTIAGVAIAVALVPPLATAGIGLGWNDWEMFYQAFLLFLTNLVGIVFAVSLVFFVKGFSPLQRAKKGLFYTLLFSILITIPLLDSFVTIVEDSRLISRLEHQKFEINGKTITLQNVSLSRDEKVEVIKCELLLSESPTKQEIKTLKLKIEERVGKRVELEALVRLRF
ncbi:MAG: Unknown protein [uncultured Sulfurovum sp.]|uniref:TIGR00341 family protein n=1 Tax=uncultured Sulfurovum sp. TaxID=269237 RepID=A0A6S6TDZ3_9BACT|nr:MAG: Unknown protein [uncultured Sulfurovum sp.]